MNDYNINSETITQLQPDTYYPSGDFYNLFNQITLKGGSKIAFDRRLSLFVHYEYDPRECLYYIEEIYTHPLPNIKDNKYDKFIKILLMNYLSNHYDRTAIKTKVKWWYELNMINEQFLELGHHKITLPDSLDYSAIKGAVGGIPEESALFNILTFYNRSYSQFVKIFDRALERLSKEYLINYRNVYLIKDNTWRDMEVADDAQEECIRFIQREVLEEMGLQNSGALFQCRAEVRERFFKKCRELYLKYGIGRNKEVDVYKAVRISYDQGQMERATTTEIKAAGDNLNRLCLEWAYNWNAVTSLPVNHEFMKPVIDYYIKI